MWRNPGEAGLDANGHDKATNGIDDDGNGYVDDVYGIDAVDHGSDPMDEAYDGGNGAPIYHGTEIAGVIGAVGNNGIGVAGINWSVQILAFRNLPYPAINGGAYLAATLECWDSVLQMKRRGVNIAIMRKDLALTSSGPNSPNLGGQHV